MMMIDENVVETTEEVLPPVEEENGELDEALTHLEEVTEKIQTVEEKMESYNGNVDEAYQFINETLLYCSNLRGYYQESLTPVLIKKHDVAFSPLSSLSYSKESLGLTIKTIFKKIKDFLVFIFKKIMGYIQSLVKVMDSVVSVSKELLRKYEELGHDKIVLDDKRSNDLFEWLVNKYEDVVYLSSDLFSSNFKPSIFGTQLTQLYLNDLHIDMPAVERLNIGDKEQFTNNVLEHFRSFASVRKPLFTQNEKDIVKAIISFNKLSTDDERDMSVFIYNIDCKHIYYYLLRKDKNGNLNLDIKSTALRKFKNFMGSVHLKASLLNDMMSNNPVVYGRELLRIIINNSSSDLKQFNSIPNIITKTQRDVENIINKLDNGATESITTQNLQTYAKTIKTICNRYYHDILGSRFKLYRFYYQFSARIFDNIISQKHS